MKSFFPFVALFVTLCSFSQNLPTTKKCKETSSDRTRKFCIIKEIGSYVDANYDIASVASFAKIGPNKIYAQFKIDARANIIDIRVKASAPELENEAIRVIQSFPDLIVDDSDTEIALIKPEVYNLPISFIIEENMLDLMTRQRITGN